MANCNTFTCFPYLPFEIRRLIWQEALSVSALWALRRYPETEMEIQCEMPLNLPLTMTFIGPAPYLIGFACKEARQIMEESYVQFDSLKGGLSASHWINSQKTVVFVGRGYDRNPVLEAFGLDEVTRFKHIAWGRDLTAFPAPYIKMMEDVKLSGSIQPLVDNVIIGRIEDVAAKYHIFAEKKCWWGYGPKYYLCYNEPWPWMCLDCARLEEVASRTDVHVAMYLGT